MVTTAERARELSGGRGIIEILGFGTSRVEPARMPKAPVPAAERALAAAGIAISEVDVVTTHNPYGCSLVFGHPQGPTGMRSVVELAAALRARGGGVGLFTGCAAGDVGAAVVIRVRD